MELINTAFKIKAGDTSFTLNDIKPGAAADDLLKFGNAYNALQDEDDAVYTLRQTYLVV